MTSRELVIINTIKQTEIFNNDRVQLEKIIYLFSCLPSYFIAGAGEYEQNEHAYTHVLSQCWCVFRAFISRYGFNPALDVGPGFGKQIKKTFLAGVLL